MLSAHTLVTPSSNLTARTREIETEPEVFAESDSSIGTSYNDDTVVFQPKCSLTEEGAAELLAGLRQARLEKPTTMQPGKAYRGIAKKSKCPKVSVHAGVSVYIDVKMTVPVHAKAKAQL